MKMLQFFVTGIATLSLLAPISSIAEPTHPNEVGLYMTPDGYGATGTDLVYVPVDVYLVLTKPADVDNNNAPHAAIDLFECQLNFNPIGNLMKLGESYYLQAFNRGDNYNIDLGYLEYRVATQFNDYPVTDESVQLIRITFFHLVPGAIEVTLGPIGITNPPAIPGHMSFKSGSGQYEIMHPISGSHDSPVFIFDGEAVPVESESLGSVKALYR